MGWIRDLPHKVLQMTHGRTTAFFVLFFLSGHALALLGKLTTTYIAYMGTLGGLVLAHSIKEDVAAAYNPPAPGGPDADATK